MKLNTILIENPQIIPGLDKLEDLDIYNVNKALFQTLIHRAQFIYHKFNDTHIVYVANNEYFCLDYDLKKISYYMKYEVGQTPILGTYLWQSLIWRAKQTPYIKTLPHDIFFNTLLPKYGTICTDGQQTNDGRDFWEYQIIYALNNNINVYYHNMQNKDLIKIKNNMHFHKLISQYDIWGDTLQYQKKLMVITNHILPQSNMK